MDIFKKRCLMKGTAELKPILAPLAVLKRLLAEFASVLEMPEIWQDIKSLLEVRTQR